MRPPLTCSTLVLCLQIGTAQAAHPLETEDTGTQGTDRVELEHGYAQSGGRGQRLRGYQLQLSWGLGPALDVLLLPSWTAQRVTDAAGTRSAQGLGDMDLDFKWRFREQAPWSWAVRAGVTLPTAQRGLGLPPGTAAGHATLVATLDAAPLAVHANLGLARNPPSSGLRPQVWRSGGALQWAVHDSLSLCAEVSATSNDDPARAAWTRRALAGVIVNMAPGLDLDLGSQAVTRSKLPARNWLLGLSWRFAR